MLSWMKKFEFEFLNFGKMMEEEELGWCSSPIVCLVCTRSKGKDSSNDLLVGACVLERRQRREMKDQQQFQLSLYEFMDCEQLTNLESLLVGLGPSVVYHDRLGESSGLKRRLEALFDHVECTHEEIAKEMFSMKDLVQDVQSLTARDDASVVGTKLAQKALAGLIAKEALVQDDDRRGSFLVAEGKLDGYMRLDAAAIEALNLFPPRVGAEYQQKEATVFGLLDRCVTKNIGARLLKQWIRQPLLNLSEIRYRQGLVTALKSDTRRREGIRSVLKSVPDLDRLLRKFDQKRVGLKEMYELYLFTTQLPELANWLKDEEKGDDMPTEALKTLGSECEQLCSPKCFAKYIELVEKVLDMSVVPREYRVQPQNDPSGELGKLVDELQDIQDRLDKTVQKLQENELQDINARFETNPQQQETYGYHFRIHKKDDNKLKKLKGDQYKYLAVVSAAIRWGTPKLKSLYDEHKSCLKSIDAAQSVLVQQAAEVAATFVPLFEAASALVARLDVYVSFAHVAAYAPSDYCLPKLHGFDAQASERKIVLNQSRHPCLECMTDVDFIPNDYEMTRGEFQIITGPNMGGKSTYIRQLGTLMVMAQMGSYLPATEAELPLVDAVLARVGASDAQMQGVSTFMAEMVEASAIVKTATKDSLVIIDELGRGTSTYDGFGLAWALSEHLATKIKPYCLFATHFHELTALANELDNVKNKHVTAMATDETITMLYTINNGPCEQSFGINIAKMANFPPSVIETAKRKAKHLEALTVIASDDKNKKLKLETVENAIKQLAQLDPAKLSDTSILQTIFMAENL